MFPRTTAILALRVRAFPAATFYPGNSASYLVLPTFNRLNDRNNYPAREGLLLSCTFLRNYYFKRVQVNVKLPEVSLDPGGILRDIGH